MVVVIFGLLALLPAGCDKPETVPAVLVNAGFELPLDSGWVQTVVNGSTPLDSGTVERSNSLGQPGSGFAARVYKYHKHYYSLSQTVELLPDVAGVHFRARFRIGANVPCSPISAIVLNYLDDADNRLARTVIGRFSSYNTWTDSDSQHLVKLSDSAGAWTPYSLTLQTELDSFLPGVERSRVKRLRVELYAYVDYSAEATPRQRSLPTTSS